MYGPLKIAILLFIARRLLIEFWNVKLLDLLLQLTYGAGAVDDKDLAVSSDQGNVWLYTPPWASWDGGRCCTLNDLPMLK